MMEEGKENQAGRNASFSFSFRISRPEFLAFFSVGSGVMSDKSKIKKKKNPKKKGK
jgi:hypothetical protein